MSKKSLIAKGLVTLSLFAQHFAWAQPVKVERPPQFVLFAFDGSYNNDIWQYSRDYTKHQKQYNVDTRFTFFINPVYLLTPSTKSYYKAPAGNRGSAIGWGDDNRDVSLRLDQMNDAYLEGHEIGSHAVGHFDGSKWSESDWNSEFKQFDYIVKNVFSINGISSTPKGTRSLKFLDSITGFRAPQLGVSTGLWPNLPKYGIKYDTSKVNTENYWPKKSEHGTWNFPLAQIQEPGGSRKWISMDYNFCVRDSSRIRSEDPGVMKYTMVDSKSGKTIKNNDPLCLKAITASQKESVKQNMMKLYRAYFNNNYYGNRAPVHIGHHFSSWMSGAYLEVFYEFASEVCGKPEVKCGTYAELMNFMDKKSSTEVAAMQAGQFAKLPRPKSTRSERHLEMAIQMTAQAEAMTIDLTGSDARKMGLKKFVTVGDWKKQVDNTVTLSEIRAASEMGQDALVRFSVENRKGEEIATATYTVKAVGTEAEVIDSENIETRWEQGHMPEAHADEVDFSKGH